ncbi:MAG: 16S rRNA (guanine(527)-N(7))-methyltransferase RsmG [Bacillota bacterium]
MMDIRVRSLLEDIEIRLKLSLNDRQRTQLVQYVEMLQEETNSQRLIGDATTASLYYKHIYDSLYPLLLKQLPEGEILDLGTGAGLPGIPLKICLPNRTIYLMDANRRRINFLRKVTRELNLSGLNLLAGRAEDWGRDTAYRERFTVIVSRAVAPAVVLVELTLPLSSVGGLVLFYKGPRGPAEFKEAAAALQICGGVIEDYWQYDLPTGESRSIYMVIKNKPTPNDYPRRVGKPAKDPLR